MKGERKGAPGGQQGARRWGLLPPRASRPFRFERAAALPREASAVGERPLVEVPLLVVAAVHEDDLGARQLVREQQHEDLDGVGAAIRHVAVEEVSVARRGLVVKLEDP